VESAGCRQRQSAASSAIPARCLDHHREDTGLVAGQLQRDMAVDGDVSLDQLLAETERNYIEAALRLAHDNVSQAARLLGINRTTLYNRMESFAREQ